MTNGDKLWRWRLKLLICRVEYPLFFFFLSNQLYTPFTEQYYYKSYGLQLIENTSTFNRDPGEAFCLTEELLTNYSGDNDTFKQVQSSANHLVAYGSLVKNIVSIVLSTLVYGPLTNRYGRKIGIVAPGIGALCQGIMAFFIIKFNLNPYYFLLAYLATGLGGDFTSILSSAFAYTADVSTMKYRSFRIGAIEASIALGGAVGVLSGGYLLESVHCNFIPPLILYLVSNAAVILFVLFVLPESTTAKERRKGAKTMKEEFIKYLKGFRMYCGELSFKKTWNVYVATIAANIASFAVVGSIILAVFFLKTSPFDLSPFKIGIYQSVRSLSQGLANIIVPGVFTLLLRNPDPWLILVAFLFSGVGYLLVGFSTQPWQIYLLAILQGVEGIAWPGSRGLASKLARPEQQSGLFAFMASLEALSSMIASTMWPVIFPATLDHHLRSGTAFFILSAISLAMLPLASTLLCVSPRDKLRDEEEHAVLINDASDIQGSTDKYKQL